jgi:hypothetical protein
MFLRIWIWILVFNATFSYIIATSFSGGRSRSTQIEPPTMGKQLVNFITCGCESNAPFCNLQSWARTDVVLVIGLYELLGNPTTVKPGLRGTSAYNGHLLITAMLTSPRCISLLNNSLYNGHCLTRAWYFHTNRCWNLHITGNCQSVHSEDKHCLSMHSGFNHLIDTIQSIVWVYNLHQLLTRSCGGQMHE